MTRLPRPKSDNKNYHEIRRPGCAQTIRLPEELLDTYVTLRRCLGPKTSHATVIRFLFEAADATITAVIQAEDARIIQDSQLHPSVSNCNQEEPEFKDVEDSEDEELSDEETMEEVGLGGADVDNVLCADSQPENVTRDPPLHVFPDAIFGFWSKTKDLCHKCKSIMFKFKEVLQEKRRTPSDCSVEAATTIAQVAVFSIQHLKDFCKEIGLPGTGNKLQLVQRVSLFQNLPKARASDEIQRQRPLRYPELAAHDIAYKLKSWIYTCAKNATARGDTTPKMLTVDVQNAADHWAGNHDTCRTLPGVRKCVVENWPQGRDCKYPEGRETHKAVKDFLKKYLTENKMKFYLRARENFISETFHSIINKYATKRIHFDASHTARLACAALDWNENIRR
ncbi:hypothetical protein R1flu_017006 [Riccia fluitans]|uniref:SAP domain-containing protein n=1 Tax=Riccia fluitans TaxID=41844 RepID=A0ABD1YPA0_9MARC